MERPPLGDQELELLRYIADFGPISVGQAVDGYGAPRGLARSTINTTVERLFKKNYLTRSLESDVFRYAAAVAPEELLDGLLDQFVRKTLAGSFTPFVSYFARRTDLSAGERAELERVIAKLEFDRKESE